MKNPDLLEKFSSIQAEKSLLGYLLINNGVFEDISDIVSSKNFFLDLHQKIFTVIKTLLDKSSVADVITVSNYATYNPAFKDITFSYLVELTNSIVTYNSYKDYSNLVHELSLKRQLLQLNNNIEGYLNSNDAFAEQIAKVEQDVFNLAETGIVEKNIDSFEDALSKAMSSAENARQYKNGISGLTTGLKDIDSALGGLQKSDLIVLAGRPSMGKTALATNMAYKCAEIFAESKTHPGAPVVIFSLEMSSEQIATRILASHVGVSGDALRKGMLNDADFNRLAIAINSFKHVPLFIDDSSGLSISQIRTKCRRLKRQHNIGLIIIDYIQLIGGDSKQNNRNTEVGEITRGLKGIAKELGVPIIALSQLSRAVESRDDKTPMLSDLRESGSIEQDADVVMFIFREEYYISRDEPKMQLKDESPDKFEARKKAWEARLKASKNKATVVIAKNRHGPIKNVDLLFDARNTQFLNVDKIHEVRP